MKRQLQAFCIAAAAMAGPAIILSAGSASAAIISSVPSANPITILGKNFNITFFQDDDGVTSFDEFFGAGSSPTFTFTTSSDAQAAAQAIINAVPGSAWEPAPTVSTVNGFRVAYASDADFYSFVSAVDGILSPFGPFTLSRSDANNFSFVGFEEIPATPIPTPGTASLALLGLIAMGAAAFRKRKQEA